MIKTHFYVLLSSVKEKKKISRGVNALDINKEHYSIDYVPKDKLNGKLAKKYRLPYLR